MNTPMLSAVVAAAFALLLPATAAQAQLTRTFVSVTGSDASNCDFATPCRTFQRAHDQTSNDGGQIACLDSGDFAGLGTTIIKTITIDCAGTASIGRNFNVNAAGIVVTIRNLRLLHGGGLNFFSGAALFLENTTISQVAVPIPTGGIAFRPSAPDRNWS